jgi:hypothetical protein
MSAPMRVRAVVMSVFTGRLTKTLQNFPFASPERRHIAPHWERPATKDAPVVGSNLAMTMNQGLPPRLRLQNICATGFGKAATGLIPRSVHRDGTCGSSYAVRTFLTRGTEGRLPATSPLASVPSRSWARALSAAEGLGGHSGAGAARQGWHYTCTRRNRRRAGPPWTALKGLRVAGLDAKHRTCDGLRIRPGTDHRRLPITAQKNRIERGR